MRVGEKLSAGQFRNAQSPYGGYALIGNKPRLSLPWLIGVKLGRLSFLVDRKGLDVRAVAFYVVFELIAREDMVFAEGVYAVEIGVVAGEIDRKPDDF